MNFLKNSIRNAFGGSYCQELEDAELDKRSADISPRDPSSVKVVVVGAGLAGMSTAISLLERGFQVTIYEAEDFVGGKCGAWLHQLSDGTKVHVSHGLHAFFPPYYNCRALFDKVGVSKFYKASEEYLIISKDGKKVGFKDIEATPVLALLSMWRAGLYRMLPVLKSPTCIWHMLEFLRFSPERCCEVYDKVSYEEFCRKGKIPHDLRLMFNTFTRSFFASPHLMSMACVMEAFHFYFMSNDGGLMYDFLNEDYHVGLCEPMTAYIEERGGKIRMKTPVRELDVEEDGRIRINREEVYDYAVMACDVVGVLKILESSKTLQADWPHLVTNLKRTVKPAQRYSVFKIWTDKRIENEDKYPSFFTFEKVRIMDSLVVCHRHEPTSIRWTEKHIGGAVYELHCYAVPESIPDSRVEESFLSDLIEYFPGMKDVKILEKHLLLNRNFTAYHVGLNKDRPRTDTVIPTLMLAGDWVRLPTSAKLMEGAVVSGMMAANRILRSCNMQTDTIYCVPPSGILARSSAALRSENQRKLTTTNPIAWLTKSWWILGIAYFVYLTNPFAEIGKLGSVF